MASSKDRRWPWCRRSAKYTKSREKSEAYQVGREGKTSEDEIGIVVGLARTRRRGDGHSASASWVSVVCLSIPLQFGHLREGGGGTLVGLCMFRRRQEGHRLPCGVLPYCGTLQSQCTRSSLVQAKKRASPCGNTAVVCTKASRICMLHSRPRALVAC